jgi:hypothetical protein
MPVLQTHPLTIPRKIIGEITIVPLQISHNKKTKMPYNTEQVDKLWDYSITKYNGWP